MNIVARAPHCHSSALWCLISSGVPHLPAHGVVEGSRRRRYGAGVAMAWTAVR